MASTENLDVVDLLKAQQEHIRELFTAVGQARSHDTKRAAFEELRRFLAVHEAAEEREEFPLLRADRDARTLERMAAEDDRAAA